jgi:AmmeMemoRadiSam system protein A
MGVIMIPQQLRRILLQSVRETVGAHLERRRFDEIVGRLKSLGEDHPLLLSRRGAFVTLKKSRSEDESSLRGCIGSMIANLPLYEEILRLAVEAAFHDPRFHPVTSDELEQINFEISVLTELTQIGSYHDIRIGTDGILLSCSGRRAVFLPQVPVEQQWDLETTLTHLCLKAGLDQDAWKDSLCSFEVFQAEVFSEGDVHGEAQM